MTVIAGRNSDRKLLMELSSQDKLIDLLLVQMRNLWAVDGLYFLSIEEKFGTEHATNIDRHVWEIMGKLEARRLRELLEIKRSDLPAVLNALRCTSWALDLEHKELIIEPAKAIFRTTQCRTQLTRLKKGLPEFPCKPVRWGYLKAFVREFTPEIEVQCIVCPPDTHPKNLWCEWRFVV
jgi:hypothetical protein